MATTMSLFPKEHGAYGQIKYPAHYRLPSGRGVDDGTADRDRRVGRFPGARTGVRRLPAPHVQKLVDHAAIPSAEKRLCISVLSAS